MVKHRNILLLILTCLILYIFLQLQLSSEICAPNNSETDSTPKTMQRYCGNATDNIYVFPDSRPRHVTELEDRQIPNIFHLVFCGITNNHSFTFNHYVIILSIWRNFEPDGIEIHYKGKLLQDNYNVWLDELRRTIPCLIVKEMPNHWTSGEICDVSYGLAVLQDRGGVYLSNDVMVTKNIASIFKKSFATFVDENNIVRMVFSSKKHNELANVLTNSLTENNVCKNETDFNLVVSSCTILETSFLPKDFFTKSRDELKLYIRSLYHRHEYVTEEKYIRRPCKTLSKIPKIVHYIWYHPVNLTFAMYLSIISSLYVINADKVYIHSDLHIYGQYWNLIKSLPQVVLVYRESPTQIFGHKIKYTTHGSDVVRADILIKYGGIYLDWDAMWLKSIDDLLSSGNDVILNYDHMVASKSFPDQINMGVAIAAPRSTFMIQWRNALINYRTDDFYYNALQLPYKIYEQHPDNVNIETRLQVMCFRLKCHPIFHSSHRDWTKHQHFDWHTVYSIHFTYPDPKEFFSEKTLYNSTGLFAEIGQYVMSKVP